MGICRKRLAAVSLKAVVQGDGLEIVRLSRSVGGWELPSGRNAKGCLEAVKATAGECPTEREESGDLFNALILVSMRLNVG